MDRVPATQAMRARGGRPMCWRSLRIVQFLRLGFRFEGLANQSDIGFAVSVAGQSKSSRVVHPKRALIAFRWSGYRLGLAPLGESAAFLRRIRRAITYRVKEATSIHSFLCNKQFTLRCSSFALPHLSPALQ